eukprot:1567901-Lingulodinium_polyedra.AAC.1
MTHEDRLVLGYHRAKQGASAFTYGRGNVSAPLRRLLQVVRDIQSCKFNPDATRAELLTGEFQA